MIFLAKKALRTALGYKGEVLAACGMFPSIILFVPVKDRNWELIPTEAESFSKTKTQLVLLSQLILTFTEKGNNFLTAQDRY